MAQVQQNVMIAKKDSNGNINIMNPQTVAGNVIYGDTTVLAVLSQLVSTVSSLQSTVGSLQTEITNLKTDLALDQLYVTENNVILTDDDGTNLVALH